MCGGGGGGGEGEGRVQPRVKASEYPSRSTTVRSLPSSQLVKKVLLYFCTEVPEEFIFQLAYKARELSGMGNKSRGGLSFHLLTIRCYACLYNDTVTFSSILRDQIFSMDRRILTVIRFVRGKLLERELFFQLLYYPGE